MSTLTSQKSSTLESSQNESFGVGNSAMEKADADMNRNLDIDYIRYSDKYLNNYLFECRQ